MSDRPNDVYPIGKKNPNLPFHPAVRAGDYIFVSGQVAKDDQGNMISGQYPASKEYRRWARVPSRPVFSDISVIQTRVLTW